MIILRRGKKKHEDVLQIKAAHPDIDDLKDQAAFSLDEYDQSNYEL